MKALNVNFYNFETFSLSQKDNFICSIYLTGGKRYGHFPLVKSIEHLRKWGDSLKANNLKGIMFHNCFSTFETLTFSNLPISFIKVPFPKTYMSGLYRFELYHWFLTLFYQYIDNVFFTDSTDLDVLKNPFIQKEYRSDKIYIGHEPVIVGNKWMVGTKKIRSAAIGYERFLQLVKRDKRFEHRKLLNAGLIGGSTAAVTPFIKRMTEECSKMYPRPWIQDMPILNYLAYTEFNDQVVYNNQVNTIFTLYEEDNKTAWFRHK